MAGRLLVGARLVFRENGLALVRQCLGLFSVRRRRPTGPVPYGVPVIWPR